MDRDNRFGRGHIDQGSQFGCVPAGFHPIEGIPFLGHPVRPDDANLGPRIEPG
jgi:hypothetical protein